MNYKDMTFCINDDCNRRTECDRALENYPNLKEDDVYSFGLFKCEESNEGF